MRQFIQLSDAVTFLSDVLRQSDDQALAAACREKLPVAWVLDELRRRNEETPLTSLYAPRQFPADASQFKLGGHAKELGHVHIDFVKSTAGWEIQKIWMCR